MGKQRNISDDAELIRKHLLNEMNAEEQEKLDSRIKECPALCNIINELQQHGTIKEEIDKLRKYSAESAYEGFLTSSMRHPKQKFYLGGSKSDLIARCFSVRKSVFVK